MKKWLISSIWFIFGIIGLFSISHFIGTGSMIPVIVVSLFLFLRYQEKIAKKKKYNYLDLGLLLVIIITAAKFIVGYPVFSVYYIPVAALSILCTILFNNITLSLVLTLIGALSAGIIAGLNLNLACILLVGGVFASFMVLNVRRRSQIIKAGIAAGILQGMCVVLIQSPNLDGITKFIIPNLLSGLLAGVVITGVLPVFEYLFNVITNITLLELSDFNHPLFRKMVLEAPGTYHHSLIVGNLSETAAESIGANSLLARIGAYYHDIGKIEKAEYFIENQPPENATSTHEQLKPSISKMVIMNHVREGVELARKYRLNDSIIDFINQHHGTSLVFYFYLRALENTNTEKEVEEEGFRYSGPRPQTKETAIVLLADSVEGATRALRDRTPKKIDELVRKVINNKFIDGQLDECDLTLFDLEKIASVFIKILSAVYHARITYPEKNSGNNHNKSTK
ncbi:MAG TPA: HDIG domain-containing protein [Candidatus Omnitrophica bacterium]|nr:HDIG domain-containing protein [Candidatus Omnitrophota bacterium]